MIKEFTLKNSKETILYILNDTVLFKINTVKLQGSKTYLFFDYTYKKTRFIGFNSLHVAKIAIQERFKEYSKKYLENEGVENDN